MGPHNITTIKLIVININFDIFFIDFYRLILYYYYIVVDNNFQL